MSLDDKTGDTEYFASTDYNQRLIGAVYLTHKALLLNPIVSEENKAKLKEHIKGNPTYANLV